MLRVKWIFLILEEDTMQLKFLKFVAEMVIHTQFCWKYSGNFASKIRVVNSGKDMSYVHWAYWQMCFCHIFVVPCVYFVVSYVYLLYYVCIAILTLDAGLLARSPYPEGPATGHLDTGFSWFPCVYKRMLRWFPSFQVATTCLSCSPPDLNFLVTFSSYLWAYKITTATGLQPNCS